ncbi:MAG: aspartate/glutamate racemase family protein [Anaerolineae bacterium]|jgi:allantoin racemase
MRKALIINPNTSVPMTHSIRETAERVFAGSWEATVELAPAGPASLESWRDYHLAGVCILPLLSRHSDADGIVLACFGDPGLFALKEVASVPVVGVAEAAMSMALLLGGQFGILAGMGRAVGLMDSMVRTYGLEARYTGTHSLNMRVLDFEAHREETLTALTQAGKCLRADGADILLLGCAGLTGFTAQLEAKLRMTVVDPVEAGCRMLKAIVDSGLSTSHAGIYARPAPQEMRHLERLFEADMVGHLKEWEEST